MSRSTRRVAVVGSGPNGLVAAIRLAHAGAAVTLFEAADDLGGGLRSATFSDGSVFDHCAGVFPFGVASPVLRELLAVDGSVTWAHAPVPLAHVVAPGRGVAVHPAVAATAAQLGAERVAPGFRDLVRERIVTTPGAIEAANANLVGGDVLAGSNRAWRMVVRPRLTVRPYRLGPRTFVCSAATPPGAGVHGLCGEYAAAAVLRSWGADARRAVAPGSAMREAVRGGR